MIWRARKRYLHGEWEPWFAWYPVRINGAWAWLETVEQCCTKNPMVCAECGCDVKYRFPLVPV